MYQSECLHCGYKGSMVLLSSLNKRICPQCRSYNIWQLKEGQKSVLIKGMVGDGKDRKDNQS